MSSARGFTLIEVLIAISIITIITGAAIPSFNQYVQNQNVKQAQEQIVDELRTLQNKALSGEKSDTTLPNGEVKYWGMKFYGGTSNYDRFVSVNSQCMTDSNDYSSDRNNSVLYGGSVLIGGDSCVYFSFANSNAEGATSLKVGPADALSSDRKCLLVNILSSGLITKSTNYVTCE